MDLDLTIPSTDLLVYLGLRCDIYVRSDVLMPVLQQKHLVAMLLLRRLQSLIGRASLTFDSSLHALIRHS